MRLLKMGWREGLEVFLYDGKLNARRSDGPLTDGDKRFLKLHKGDLVTEIRSLTSGTRISGEDFYGAGLMADAAEKRLKK